MTIPDTASSAARAGWDRLLTPGRFALVLAVFLAATYPLVLAGLETFFFRDFFHLVYPAAYYQRECFWRGELPLWNPLSNCGIPFLAQWYTLALYPPALIYLLLPLPWSVNVFNLAHLYLAGLGMYFLARRWTASNLGAAAAGIALTFSGLGLSSLMWTSIVAAVGWMPWVLYLGEVAWREGGRRLWPGVGAGALLMLTGTPELTLMTWLVLGALFVCQWTGAGAERLLWLGRALALVALVALLCAAQLLPFLELLEHSQRSAGYGGDRWAMPSTGWANFLVPQFYTFAWSHGVRFQYDQAAVTSYYAGAGVFALALFAALRVRSRKVWFLAAVTAVAFVFALGESGRVFAWLRQLVPALGFMRFPVKMIFPVLLTLPLLAAFAIAHLERADTGARREWRWLAGVVVACLAGIGGIVWFASAFPKYPPPYAQVEAVVASGISRAILLALIAGALFLALRRGAVSRLATGAGVALLALLWADGITQGPALNPRTSPQVFTPHITELEPKPVLGAGRALAHPRAEVTLHKLETTNAVREVVLKRNGYYSNLNLLEGVPKAHGIYSVFLREPEEVIALLFAAGDPGLPRLSDFMAISAMSLPASPMEWVVRSNALPVITAGQRPEFRDGPATLAALRAPDFAPADVVYLPTEAKDAVSANPRADARVQPGALTSHRIEFQVSASAPTLAVIAQSHYPAWRATVNGQPARLWRANHAFQAVEVPAGESRVELKYVDRRFQAGALISGLTLIGCLGAWWTQGRRANAPAGSRPG